MTRNLLLVYVLLVGLPVLVVVGTLEAGRSIAAPPAIAGSWSLETSDIPAAAGGCPGKLDMLAIKQSGVDISLSWGGETMDGTWAGGRYLASSGRAAYPGCGKSPVEIEIRPSGVLQKRYITGTVSFPDCPACGKATFRGSKRTSKEPA